MELDKIGQVTETLSKNTANDLLGKGWVLLDAKVVQFGTAEGGMTGRACYILGKKL